MELKKNCLDAFEVLGTMMLTQEETAETIVPDYCPDIARVIRTEGKVYIHSRQILDGKAEVGGTVRVNVLYTPDGESGLRTLEFSIPFTAESEKGSFPMCRILTAEADLAALETRTLNPRKVMTRCKLITRMSGYRKQQLSFGMDVSAEERLAIQKKQMKQSVVLLTGISEKDFSFTDEFGISGGRDGAAELLSWSIYPEVTDSKPVGNRMICKGSIHLGLLYRDVGGSCCFTETEMPFSQVLDMEEQAENAVTDVRIQLTGADLQISGEDPSGRQISVTLYLHATALLYQEQEITLLEDLYSTIYAVSYGASPMELTAQREVLQRRQSAREILEIGIAAESILALSVRCGAVSIGKDGKKTTVLRTPATIHALYQDEGGSVLFAERTTEITCHMELPENCTLTAEAISAGEIQGSIGDRGIEVRFQVDFRICMERKVQRVCISDIRLDSDRLKDTAAAPSLVLRCLDRHETLWDIAKQYHTTIRDILAANQAEHESDIPFDQLLLIPKKRA